MEYLKQARANQRSTEWLVVSFFTVYALLMCVTAVKQGWPSWIPTIYVFGVIWCWVIVAVKYKTFKVRAMIVTAIMELSFILCTTNITDLDMTMSAFLVLLIFVSLYGLTDVLWITDAAVVFIMFYFLVIHPVGQQMIKQEYIKLLFLIANVVLMEIVLYIWVKRRNENIEQMYSLVEALIDAERSKDDFLANVSHEIRTPLNTICGMSEMALREQEFEKMREELFDIQSAGRNLMSLVSDILDFSQLQSGKMELEEEVYNITSTINDVINMSMAKKMEKNIELIVDCDAGIPCGLVGDEKKIRRVIMNLVNNAIKYTNEGCVSIIVEGRREAYGINLSVTVRDTGIGISDEELEKLFTSFSQIDTKRNRQEGGVGLGLAISKALIQKMGGTITVNSRIGKGSELRFVIPQKIDEDIPIAQVDHRADVNIAVYTDMEQYDMIAVRDEWTRNIRHMVEQTRVKCHVCRNLPELKRREESQNFTHIFISLEEYQQDPVYFDLLAQKTKVILIIDQSNDRKVSNHDLIRLYKPFYIIPIVSILNGSLDYVGGAQLVRHGKFRAPDAKILVVDDNLMNIRVVEGLLKEYQIQVIHALSGMEALELIESRDYDFVFMDHMMPEMDGIETLHRIREKMGYYYQQVPIIALTANAAPGNRELFLAEGFADFVSKPVEISILERVLKRNLPAGKIIYAAEENYEKTLGDNHTTSHVDKNTEDSVSVGKKDDVANPDAVSAGLPESDAKEFVIGELEVQNGLAYCGGKETYLDIVKECCKEAAEKHRELQSLYEQQDWKKYIITVHGLKSTMKSIGATSLAEQARGLEMAGRAENYDLILKEHDALLAEYRRVMDEVAASPLVFPIEEAYRIPWFAEKSEKSKHYESDLPQISEEEWDRLVSALEDIMFDFDADAMLAILSDMEAYQYYGTPLDHVLSPVKRKIEMSDFISAVDLLKEIRKRLQKGGL